MYSIQASDEGFWLFTQNTQISLSEDNLPYGTAQTLNLLGSSAVQIGTWQNKPLRLVLNSTETNRTYVDLRSQLYRPEQEFYLLNRGVALNHFFRSHQFCGKCGAKTQKTQDEWAVQCENSACQYRTYPVICPSIIVAVRRGKQILLANHLRHKGRIYTTIAGFVEVGETFEQAVHREVFEETGIKIKNLRYFASQPWAFPNAQMVGFLADYDEGEIRIQETEIHDANWFAYDQPLPELPPKGTIALKLIEHTLQLCATENE